MHDLLFKTFIFHVHLDAQQILNLVIQSCVVEMNKMGATFEL